MHNRLFITAVMALLAAPAVSRAQAKITFQDNALPIFRSSCMNCHNADKKRGGLDLSSFAALSAGGGTGKVVVPGDPEGSLLFKLVTHQAEPNMPPKGKLADKDIETIKKWIAGGALENSGSKAVPLKKAADLTVVVATNERPAGPPPMPEILPLDPAVHNDRAGAVPSLAASPWAPLIALGGQRDVLLYHARSRDLLGVLPFPEGTPKVLKFSRSGKILLAGGGMGARLGKVALFDVATGRRIAEVGDELDEVLAADVSPDQSKVALGGPSKTVKIYATGDGAELQKLTKHTDWITAIAYSPDGVLLATGDRNGGLRVWEAGSGEEFYVLDGHTAAITDVAFRADANVLLSASEDGTVKLWNMLADGKPIKSWDAHAKQGVLSIDFAHDGTIVSSGRDKVVRLWKADGSPLRDLTTMNDIALRAVLSDDGKLAVAGDFSGSVRLIQTTDAKPAGDLDPTPPTVEQRLAETQKTVAALEPALAAKADALTQSQAAADQAAAELAAAQKKADEAKAVAGAAQAERDALAQQLETAKAEQAKLQASQVLVALNAAKAELETLANDHATKVAALQQSEAAAKQTQDQIALAEKSVAEAPLRLKAGEDRLAAAKTASTTAATASTTAQASLDERKSLVTESTGFQQKLAEAAAKTPDNKAFGDAAKKAGESLELLKTELASAEASLTGAAAAVQKAAEEVTAAEAALAKEKADTAAAPAAIEQLRQTATAAVADIAAKRAAADAALPPIAPAKAKVDQLQAEFDKLKAAAGINPSSAPATQPV